MVGLDDYSRVQCAAERSFTAALRGLTLGAAVVLLTSCSGNRELGDYPESTCDLGEPPGALRDVPIGIATFWSDDDAETAAFKKLTDHVDGERYFVRTDEMPDRVATQQHIRDAFDNQQLPDLFQVNGGSDVLGWVEGRQGEARDLCALDALRARNGWGTAYFEEALAPLSCDGSLYALPVGIHHINVLFYNRPLFDQLRALAAVDGVDLTPPEALESPQQLVELLAQVSILDTRSLGRENIVPLAIGSSNDWPLTIVAFENVLLGLGHQAYETLWKGGLEGDDGTKAAKLEASLREMLDVLRDLVTYSNFAEHHKWQTALQQVGSGEALFTITGDWGYAQLASDQLPNIATVTFPGTRGTFVYTPDSFAVPRDLGKNGYQARAFLQDAAQDKSALIAFSNAKHAIPPRTDLEADELAELTSPGLRATYEEFSDCARGVDDCRLQLAVSGLGPSPGIDPCLDEADAILALAVAGRRAPERKGGCKLPMPISSKQAEEHLLKIWLDVAKRRFAASCR